MRAESPQGLDLGFLKAFLDRGAIRPTAHTCGDGRVSRFTRALVTQTPGRLVPSACQGRWAMRLKRRFRVCRRLALICFYRTVQRLAALLSLSLAHVTEFSQASRSAGRTQHSRFLLRSGRPVLDLDHPHLAPLPARTGSVQATRLRGCQDIIVAGVDQALGALHGDKSVVPLSGTPK